MITKGFHFELTNICTLKCPGCARTRFIEQFPNNWKNHSIDLDELLAFIDIDISDHAVALCGNYGDPIYHPRFLELVKEFKKLCHHVAIVTNGSYKTEKWWETLIDILGPEDRLQFSIDGLPHNFTQYRINADWKSIEVGLRVAGQSDIQTEWSYIPFTYNEKDIDAARALSESYGIKTFMLNPSDRWDEKTQHLMPSNVSKTSWATKQYWKENNTIGSVMGKCETYKEHFVTANGYYAPCCYLADHRFYYKTEFWKQREQYKISNTTFSKIIEQTENFYNRLEQQPGCQFNCGVLDGNY
jgi:MoaA/NifB/PqqE/SkfB family radical SAM enzyme